MAEETPTTGTVTIENNTIEEKPDVEAKEQKSDADIEEIAAQAQNPDAVRNALKAERQTAKTERERADTAEARAKELEDEKLSDQEKKDKAATEAGERADKAEARLLRYEVAVEKKLPLELADRLQGDTKGQLEKDADRLLELVKREDKPSGDADGGKGEGGEGKTFNDMLR